jgi:DNA-binding YbaB/EbfC family protein
MNPESPFGISQWLDSMQRLRSDLDSAKHEIADAVAEGSSADGLVRAVMSGEGELTQIRISPDAISSLDPAVTARDLETMVLTAVREAHSAVADLCQAKIEPLTAMLGSASGSLRASFQR